MSERSLMYVLSSLAVFRLTYHFVRWEWWRPLKHGPGFFLTCEVPAGFYEADGIAWLRRFRTVLVAVLVVVWAGLIALVASDHWRWLPSWAGGSAVLYVASQGLFGRSASRTLGRAETQTAVAVSLAARRLRDYLSWPTELAMAGILLSGWLLILFRGDAGVRWVTPATVTYVVLALLVAKVVVIRSGAPLPPEGTEDQYRYVEADRRQRLRAIDAARWFWIFLFAGYTTMHGRPVLVAAPWLRWALIVTAVGIWTAMVVVISGSMRRLDALRWALRPPGSWAGPFRPSPWASPGARIWAASFLAGLAVLWGAFYLLD